MGIRFSNFMGKGPHDKYDERGKGFPQKMGVQKLRLNLLRIQRRLIFAIIMRCYRLLLSILKLHLWSFNGCSLIQLRK